MNKKVERNYLEITSVSQLIEPSTSNLRRSINLVQPDNFQINKFFYKNIGKNHNWVDRLRWSEKQWIEYSSDKKVKTYILRIDEDLAGFYELVLYKEKYEIEIAYLGLLEEYRNKKLGSYLLSSAIKKSLSHSKIKRTWVHTCSLDHKNALNNYLARGMKIFRTETILI